MVEIRSEEDLSGIGRILFHWAVGTFQLVALREFGQGIPETEVRKVFRKTTVHPSDASDSHLYRHGYALSI